METEAGPGGERRERLSATGPAIGTRRVGELGEQMAADHLVRRGFTILQRNYRTRWGEIDIIAFDGRTLVFCEVKSRRSSRTSSLPGPAAARPGPATSRWPGPATSRWPGPAASGPSPAATGPFESLHPRKRAQVRRMATSWMSERFERPFAALVRFDAIGVTFDRRGALVRLEHLEGAF